MSLFTRRAFLRALAGGALTAVGLGVYASLIEPSAVAVTRYAPALPRWPADLPLRVVALSDIHACEPWLSEARLRALCAQANALQPDVVMLLGDYNSGPQFSRAIPNADWARALGTLQAPLGVHAVLGNHDYWSDGAVQAAQAGRTDVEKVLSEAGIAVHINQAVRLETAGGAFWLAGLGDQWAYRRRGGLVGIDDLHGTLAQVSDQAPVILMAHEPDIFPDVPERVSLTLSGHTHAGQIQLMGFAPAVPSRFGSRYRYGHIVEQGRSLIVSAGLGFSNLPLRFGARPEILLIELGQTA